MGKAKRRTDSGTGGGTKGMSRLMGKAVAKSSRRQATAGPKPGLQDPSGLAEAGTTARPVQPGTLKRLALELRRLGERLREDSPRPDKGADPKSPSGGRAHRLYDDFYRAGVLLLKAMEAGFSQLDDELAEILRERRDGTPRSDVWIGCFWQAATGDRYERVPAAGKPTKQPRRLCRQATTAASYELAFRDVAWVGFERRAGWLEARWANRLPPIVPRGMRLDAYCLAANRMEAVAELVEEAALAAYMLGGAGPAIGSFEEGDPADGRGAGADRRDAFRLKTIRLWENISDDAHLSVKDLADTCALDYDCLRGRLRRWRRKHTEGWWEDNNSNRNDVRITYQFGAVRSLCEKLLRKSQEEKANIDRPSKPA